MAKEQISKVVFLLLFSYLYYLSWYQGFFYSFYGPLIVSRHNRASSDLWSADCRTSSEMETQKHPVRAFRKIILH